MSRSLRVTQRSAVVDEDSESCDKRISVDNSASTGDKVRVAIVGISDSARDLAHTLAISKKPEYEIVGFFTVTPDIAAEGMNILGHASEIFDVAKQLNIDEIIVAVMPVWQRKLAGSIAVNSNSHPTIRLVPSVYEALVCNPKLAKVKDLPLVTLNLKQPLYFRAFKRIFDLVFSATALVVFLPVLISAATMMKMTSPGPVLYK